MTIGELKKYVFENSKIEYVLESLQCHNIKFHDQQNYFSAAFPDGDNPQGVIIQNDEYLNFNSYSRSGQFSGESNDIITLIEYITKKNFLDSLKYLHEILGLEYKWQKNCQKSQETKEEDHPLYVFKKHESKNKKNKVNVDDVHVLDEELLDEYVPLLHIDWYKEGIMPWTRDKFGICYSYRYKRIIIPIRYWATGELVATNARTTITNWEEFNIKKYILTNGYNKQLNLYGLYENYNAIQKAGYVVVAESEKSCLKRDSLCDSTVVALSGKSISDEQVAILIGLNVEIVLALDKDVDINEVRFLCEKFYNIRPVSYIYDKWRLLDDKDSPTDKGNKIYQFLFKYRVKYTKEEHDEYKKSLEKK